MKSDVKNRRRLIVCLTGMPGAGKSTVAHSLKEKGFSVIAMGDMIREEARQQNLDPTDTNLGDLMLKLRKDLGPGAIAHLILRKIKREGIASSGRHGIVVDGIRGIAEVDILKRVGCVKLLAIHASTNRRFTHLKERARSDDPSVIEDFVTRDKRELTVGISEAIALADETLSNNDLTIDQLKEKAFTIIKEWLNSSYAK
ncbi:MAG: AAA family ATPase [Nitrososphaeraceae archaeon]|jgi:dephospho-CoA kinase